MIEYDGTTWLGRTRCQIKQAIDDATGRLRQAWQRLPLGRLRWKVTTNITSLDDVVLFDDLKCSEGVQPADKPKPGLLGSWCASSCEGRFRQVGYDTWAFSREDDARQFDLLWGAGKESPVYKHFDRRTRPSAA